MSVYVDSSLKQVLEVVDREGMGLAILVDKVTRKFLGLLTDGDIRRAMLSGHGLESRASDIQRPETTVVGSVKDDYKNVLSKLSQRIRFIPILDENGTVVDFVRWDKSVRIPVSSPLLGLRELELVTECVMSGWVSSAGTFVTAFENAMADYCNTRFAISTSSGTTALHLTLLALGLKPGDEVIVPTLSFVATANAVTYTGATPVFVDIDPQTWTITAFEIEKAITRKTRAIVAVHLYGHPAEMAPILAIASKYNIVVVEDAAQAHGATYEGKRVGGLGKAGIFSFFGNKIVTTGEGGMITTNDPDINARARLFRDHGMSTEKKYWHTVLGYNYRLTNLQAALGVAQMEKIDSIVARKKELAIAYDTRLRSVRGIKIPRHGGRVGHVYWLYTVLVDPELFGCSRDSLRTELLELGIETRNVFPPIHSQPIYNTGQNLPIAQSLAQNGLSLPSSVSLTHRDVDKIVDAIEHIGNRHQVIRRCDMR